MNCSTGLLFVLERRTSGRLLSYSDLTRIFSGKSFNSACSLKSLHRIQYGLLIVFRSSRWGSLVHSFRARRLWINSDSFLSIIFSIMMTLKSDSTALHNRIYDAEDNILIQCSSCSIDFLISKEWLLKTCALARPHVVYQNICVMSIQLLSFHRATCTSNICEMSIALLSVRANIALWNDNSCIDISQIFDVPYEAAHAHIFFSN